jgi:hypothetical protein
MRYYWIYDTPALVGHASGTSRRVRAGLRMAHGDPGFRLTVPATCLLEAYQQAPPQQHYLLDRLATHPVVAVEPVGDDLRVIAALGQLTYEIGRAGAGHAAQLALAGEGPCVVFTDLRMPAGVLARPI